MKSVIPPIEGVRPEALREGVLASFANAPVTDISDVVGRFYTMDSRIRPLYEGMPRVFGLAVTVKAIPGDNWAIHAGLSRCQTGDVLIIDWRGFNEGCGTGALSVALAMQRGLAGVVIDGAWRDIGELKELDFPIMGTGISPFSPGAKRLGEVNVPISCGGVVVQPGDLIVGDMEGVAVVPRNYIELVASHLPATAKGPDIPACLQSDTPGVSAAAASYWAEVGRARVE